MGTFIVGVLTGLTVGILLGRQMVARTTSSGPKASASLLASAQLADGPAPMAIPNSRAKKAGLTEADFRPTDDILLRMQEAWERGGTLDEPGAPANPLPHRGLTEEPVAAETVPQAESSAGTVTEAVAQLMADGYGDDLRIVEGQLKCGNCDAIHDPAAVEVDRVLRFEGPSDPADEAIVLALRCPECDTLGSLVSAFGPDADPRLAEAFVYLASKARHR